MLFSVSIVNVAICFLLAAVAVMTSVALVAMESKWIRQTNQAGTIKKAGSLRGELGCRVAQRRCGNLFGTPPLPLFRSGSHKTPLRSTRRARPSQADVQLAVI